MAYYNWECKNCGEGVEVTRSIKDYEVPPTEEEVAHFVAEDCSHEFFRTISETSFMSTERHVGRMEFSKDKARQDLIEAGKIEKEMLNLPHDKRKEHKKAIKKLKGTGNAD